MSRPQANPTLFVHPELKVKSTKKKKQKIPGAPKGWSGFNAVKMYNGEVYMVRG